LEVLANLVVLAVKYSPHTINTVGTPHNMALLVVLVVVQLVPPSVPPSVDGSRS
jgi:Ca2+/H+ antiporter